MSHITRLPTRKITCTTVRRPWALNCRAISFGIFAKNPSPKASKSTPTSAADNELVALKKRYEALESYVHKFAQYAEREITTGITARQDLSKQIMLRQRTDGNFSTAHLKRLDEAVEGLRTKISDGFTTMEDHVESLRKSNKTLVTLQPLVKKIETDMVAYAKPIKKLEDGVAMSTELLKGWEEEQVVTKIRDLNDWKNVQVKAIADTKGTMKALTKRLTDFETLKPSKQYAKSVDVQKLNDRLNGFGEKLNGVVLMQLQYKSLSEKVKNFEGLVNTTTGKQSLHLPAKSAATSEVELIEEDDIQEEESDNLDDADADADATTGENTTDIAAEEIMTDESQPAAVPVEGQHPIGRWIMEYSHLHKEFGFPSPSRLKKFVDDLPAALRIIAPHPDIAHNATASRIIGVFDHLPQEEQALLERIFPVVFGVSVIEWPNATPEQKSMTISNAMYSLWWKFSQIVANAKANEGSV